MQAKQTSELIDSKFIQIDSIVNELYNLDWIYKFMTEKNVFIDSFTPLHKIDYCRDLRRYVEFGDFTTNIAIIYPYKDTVVTGDNWYTIKDFLSWMKIKNNIDFTVIFEQLKGNNLFNVIYQRKYNTSYGNYLFFFKKLELTQYPRAYALFYIDKKSIQNSISEMVGLDVISMRIVNNKNTVLSINKQEKQYTGVSHQITTRSSIFHDWEYVYTYKYTYTDSYVKKLYALIIIAVICLILGTVIVYVFASLTYKPLYNLINKIFNTTKDSINLRTTKEYQLIETLFDNIREENNLVKENAKKYQQEVKNNILMRLIRGYFESDTSLSKLKESFQACGISFHEDDYFVVGIIYDIISDEKYDNIYDKSRLIIKMLDMIQSYMESLHQNYNIYESIDRELVIIFSFTGVEPSHQEIEKLISNLRLHIKKTLSVDILISVGDVYQGLIGISKSYYGVKDNIRYTVLTDGIKGIYDSKGESLYYYPTDWEIQLIENLKVGNNKVVQRILNEIFAENKKRGLSPECAKKLISIIIETMLRVLQELDIDDADIINSLNNISCKNNINIQWQCLMELGAKISGKTFQLTALGIEQSKKNNIVRYVEENYNDSDLSLKQISNKFGMPLSSLSKAFKEQTGFNFSDYLLTLRMEKAKVLLQSNYYDIKTIAQMVGYDNEYSFRRAFLRYEKIKPTDYVKQTSFN